LFFHPGIGPLYSIITQKIRKGRFAEGSELQLEIAEIDIEDLVLEGSLLIEGMPPLGTYDASGYLQYGQECRCTLKQVTIHNQGIDRKAIQHYWKNEITRRETIKIILHEGAEFYAEGITLQGSHVFEVPARHRLVLQVNSNGQLKEELSPITQPTWYWKYTFDSQDAIQLRKVHTRGKRRKFP
jgi:hypothetical protein